MVGKNSRSWADPPVFKPPPDEPVAAVRNRGDVLPLSLPPRGLSRVQAAAYIGVSPSLFDVLVGDGRMPQPKRINARTVWDLRKIDRAFDALPQDGPDDDAERLRFAL